jgi:hypothetical protein
MNTTYLYVVGLGADDNPPDDHILHHGICTREGLRMYATSRESEIDYLIAQTEKILRGVPSLPDGYIPFVVVVDGDEKLEWSIHGINKEDQVLSMVLPGGDKGQWVPSMERSLKLYDALAEFNSDEGVPEIPDTLYACEYSIGNHISFPKGGPVCTAKEANEFIRTCVPRKKRLSEGLNKFYERRIEPPEGYVRYMKIHLNLEKGNDYIGYRCVNKKGNVLSLSTNHKSEPQWVSEGVFGQVDIYHGLQEKTLSSLSQRLHQSLLDIGLESGSHRSRLKRRVEVLKSAIELGEARLDDQDLEGVQKTQEAISNLKEVLEEAEKQYDQLAN